MSAPAKDIINKLLIIEPENRLGAGDDNEGFSNDFEALKAHPFFNGVNWDTL
jgi:hypothetical protein